METVGKFRWPAGTKFIIGGGGERWVCESDAHKILSSLFTQNHENEFQPDYTNEPDETTLLNTRQAAAFLNLTKRCLDMWRMKKKGPKFIKMGTKVVRYTRADLKKFVLERSVQENEPAFGHYKKRADDPDNRRRRKYGEFADANKTLNELNHQIRKVKNGKTK